MELDKNLVSEFAKITNDEKRKQRPVNLLGTVVEYEGTKYVKLDGSDILTPIQDDKQISSTVEIQDSERVTVQIQDHTATVTGNITSPAARLVTVTDLGIQVNERVTYLVEDLGNENGSTVIHGGHIKTNTITAEKLTVGAGGNLYALGYDTFENLAVGSLSYRRGLISNYYLDTSQFYYGTKSLKVVTSSTAGTHYIELGSHLKNNGRIRLDPSKIYCLSFYAKVFSVSEVTVAGIPMMYSSLTAASYSFGASISKTIKESDGWLRVFGAFRVTETAPYVSIRFEIIGESVSINFDAVQIEELSDVNQEPGPFTPAAVTSIDMGSIITGSISADRISGGTISANDFQIINDRMKLIADSYTNDITLSSESDLILKGYQLKLISDGLLTISGLGVYIEAGHLSGLDYPWTPTVVGASSYSSRCGWYVRLGEIVIAGFYCYVTMGSGHTSEQVKITGLEAALDELPTNIASGGGTLSGYHAAADVRFMGWRISKNGAIYAVGQHTNTSNGTQWASDDVFCGSAAMALSGTICFQVGTGTTYSLLSLTDSTGASITDSFGNKLEGRISEN